MSDWPDETTPGPLDPTGLSKDEADQVLLENEVRRLRLQVAALTAEREELQTQLRKAAVTIRVLTTTKGK